MRTMAGSRRVWLRYTDGVLYCIKGKYLTTLSVIPIQNQHSMKEVIFIIIKEYSMKTMFAPIRAPDAQS